MRIDFSELNRATDHQLRNEHSAHVGESLRASLPLGGTSQASGAGRGPSAPPLTTPFAQAQGVPPQSGSPLSALRSPLSPPRGLTLIELLVVIVIITTIVAAAIPIMAPSSEDRRLRESTRGLTTFVLGAQSRAIAQRRPFGVAIKRLSQDTAAAEDNAVSVEIFYAEQLPAYTGFDENSRVCVSHLHQLGLAMVRFVTRGTPRDTTLPHGWVADLFPTLLIRPGDVIEIGGTRFELLDHTLPQYRSLRQIRQLERTTIDKKNGGFYQTSGSLNNEQSLVYLLVQPMNDTGQLLAIEYDDNGNRLNDPTAGVRPADRPLWTGPAPYKILRQPTITAEEPYQLPEGTAIDLRASGVGANDYFYVPGMHDNKDPIYLMFTPEGRVERVRYNQKNENFSTAPDDIADGPVVDNVFLLVGRRENAPPPAANDDPTLNATAVAAANTDEKRQELRETLNWLNVESRWVVFGPQSGRVVTVENAFVDLQPILAFGTLSNEEKRNKQIIAAREFTREMSQMGGR